MLNKILLAIMILLLLALLGWCSPQCSKPPNPADQVKTASTGLGEAINSVKETASDAVGAAKDAGSAVVEGAKDAGSAVVEGAKEAGAAVVEVAKDAATGTAEVVTDSGKVLSDAAETAEASAGDTAANATDTAADSGTTKADGEKSIVESTAEAVRMIPEAMGVATDNAATRVAAAMDATKPDEAGGKTKVVLEGVNFKFNSDELTKGSIVSLEKVVASLKQKQDIKVEIAGYTDNTGNAAYNLDLSQRRAESVVAFLKNAGIEAARLAAKGYGADSPVADNSTPEGRLENRRVELHVK